MTVVQNIGVMVRDRRELLRLKRKLDIKAAREACMPRRKTMLLVVNPCISRRRRHSRQTASQLPKKGAILAQGVAFRAGISWPVGSLGGRSLVLQPWRKSGLHHYAPCIIRRKLTRRRFR